MMLLKQRLYCFYKFILIISIFIRQSYQQNQIPTTVFNKDLTFCIKNHTISNTLQTFWHDANADCELDAKGLLDLYRQLFEATPAQEDQCSALLKHQVRKKLIQVISTQLEESLIVKSLKTNRDLKQNLNNLQMLDGKVAQIIWERAINEVYLFVEPEQIINEIIETKEQQIKFAALEGLLNNYINSFSLSSGNLLPLLSYHLNSLFESKTISFEFEKNLRHLYRRLPKELRFLVESSQQKIGLLNYRHFEYLYAPRDNGPDAERRLPLTWSETKNSTDSDGHLVVTFDVKGLVAFGSRFGSALKYLYVDKEHQAPYFWIGAGLKTSRWWQFIWPHASLYVEGTGYVLFENVETGYLLCATTEYDENRRYVTLLSSKENMENSACFWLVTRF